MAEHTFDLNNVERTWTDAKTGWEHAICSCGVHLSAASGEGMVEVMLNHIKEGG